MSNVERGLRLLMPVMGPGPPVLDILDSSGNVAQRGVSRPQPGMRIMVNPVLKIDTGGERRVLNPLANRH